MKVKQWIPLVLALVLGGVAAKMTRDTIARRRGDQHETNVVAVVTAARDIEAGQEITPADFTTGKVAPDSAPTGSFNDVSDVKLKDRVASARIVRGLPITDSMLAPEGTAAGVQALIPPGMRALTIQVNEFSGVAGLLLPGSKVDIISLVKGDEKLGTVARTVVQNVEIRAVGRQIQRPANAAPAQPTDSGPGAPPPPPPSNNVTLLVTPEQAEAIQLASVGGSPWLVLRNSKDDIAIETTGVSMADLRGDGHHKGIDDVAEPVKTAVDPFADTSAKGAQAAVEPAAAGKFSPRTRTVKFIRNGKEQEVTVVAGDDIGPAAAGGTTATTRDPADLGSQGE